MSCSAKRDPNGTWHIQYRWTDWTGTKKKSQKRGFKTKKEAEEWYAHFIMQQTSDPTMTLKLRKEQYYGWIDKFANELINYASIDKFLEKIRWDVVRTFMKSNK